MAIGSGTAVAGPGESPLLHLRELAWSTLRPAAARWADRVHDVHRGAGRAAEEAAAVWRRSAPPALSGPARRWRRWARRRALPPARAWLPMALAIAAVASVAPLHVVAAAVLVGLPAANGAARTRHRYERRRWERGRRWHDRVTRPVVFAGEAGRAAGATAARAAMPLAVVGAAATTAVVGLRLVDPGGRLSSAGRIAWALAVGLVALAATAPRPPLG